MKPSERCWKTNCNKKQMYSSHYCPKHRDNLIIQQDQEDTPQ